jgi:hypothetical protein
MVLIVLTQVVVLHWSLEVVFFVTWFFLALSVQHDSRLSSTIGVVFLAVCPFLLATNKEPLAEQAANYAYFFLAIGVLVQLEEMVLERFGWLNRKMDFSDQWRPIRTLWQKWWGVYPEIHLSRSTRLLRGGVALVVLSIAIVVTVWLSILLNANQLSHMKVSYDFIDHLDMAIYPIPLGEGTEISEQEWDIDQEAQRVLFQSPAFAGSSRILYQVEVPHQSKLVFDVAMDPASWELEGDGVAYRVYIVADGITQQVFSAYIDPKNNPADQRWDQNVIDMDKYSGKMVSVIFETNTGPVGDYRFDWSGWGEPRLLQP